jgi:DNA-binding transcriptional regulator YiaG
MSIHTTSTLDPANPVLTGDVIRKFREDKNLTQQQFAQLLGIGVATVNRWERNLAKPSGTAEAILKTLIAPAATSAALIGGGTLAGAGMASGVASIVVGPIGVAGIASYAIYQMLREIFDRKPIRSRPPASSFITKAGRRVLTDSGHPGMDGIQDMVSSQTEMIQTNAAALIFNNLTGEQNQTLSLIIEILSSLKDEPQKEELIDEIINWLFIYKTTTGE